MAVPTFVSSAASSAATFTMPAYAVGDLILVFAYQATSNTAPVNPDGVGGPTSWTTLIQTAGTNLQGLTVAYRIAHITGLTSSTWTNSTRMLISVWRGAARQPPRLSAVTDTAATTAGTFPALTLADPGHSAVCQALFAAAGTALGASAAADVTRLNTQGSAPIAVHERNTTARPTSWAAHTATITTSSKFQSVAVEIIGGPEKPHILSPNPALIRSSQW